MSLQTHTPKIVWLGPILTIALAAGMTALKWNALPDRIALHSGVHGPDIWIATSPQTVYGFLLAGAIICASMLAGTFLIRMTPRSSPSTFAGSILLPLSYLIAIGFALAPIAAIFHTDAGILILLSTMMIVGLMGTRLRRSFK